MQHLQRTIYWTHLQITQKNKYRWYITVLLIINIMCTKSPKCTNEYSFKYSILISLHYYELNNHKERINQLK